MEGTAFAKHRSVSETRKDGLPLFSGALARSPQVTLSDLLLAIHQGLDV